MSYTLATTTTEPRCNQGAEEDSATPYLCESSIGPRSTQSVILPARYLHGEPLLLRSNPIADAFSFLYPHDACTELPSLEGYLRSEVEGDCQRSRCPSYSLILPFQLSTERRRLAARPQAVSARSFLMVETSSARL